MGKILIIIVFVITIGLSLYTYLQIEMAPTLSPDLSSSTNDATKIPLIELEDFTYLNYNRHVAADSFTGNYGFFMDPNILQSFGNNELRKFSADKKEIMRSKIITIFFNSKGLSGVLKKAELQRAELEGDVTIIEGDKTIKTSRATYLAKDNTITSEEEVFLKAKNHTLNGKKGFIYKLNNKDLDIFGPISGSSLR